MSLSKLESTLFHKLQEHAETLRTLSPRQFEQLIAALLSAFGWQIQPEGCDFRAVSEVNPGLHVTWLVQCKTMPSSRAIGVEEVRSLYGAKMEAGASNALLATNSKFTQGAKDFAESRSDLHLVDSDKITAWLKEYNRQSHLDAKP